MMEQRSSKSQAENGGKIRPGRTMDGLPSMRPVSWISSIFTNKAIFLCGLILVSFGIFIGCERPDPRDTTVQMPAETDIPVPTPTAMPTQPPIQVFILVVQPTPDHPQTVVRQQPASAPVSKSDIFIASPTPLATAIEPTPLPPDFYQGWAWSKSLKDDRGQVKASNVGLTLRDRPSQDGRVVGVVFGLVDVYVAGRDRCGYTPILVHEVDMITKTTPRPEVLPPEPLPTEPPLFTPVPVPTNRFTDGWAYTDELTLLGQTAISGPLGINLRLDPCRAATNLGFIPAGSNMIVTGPPGKEYTAVRVSSDILQLPFDLAELSPPSEEEMLASHLEDLPLPTSPILVNAVEPQTPTPPSPTPVMMAAPLIP